MGAEPRHTHYPKRTRQPPVLRRGIAPYIGIVVAYRSAAAVHLPSRHPAVLPHTLDMVEKRRMAVGKVLHFRAPVVHFRIDIYRVLSAPRRPHILVPYALQIQRQSILAAARYHKVARKIEVHFRKLVVPAALADFFQTFVRRQLGISAAVVAQLQRAAVVQLFIVGNMPRGKIFRALANRSLGVAYGKLFVISAAESRSTGDSYHCKIGVFHLYPVSVGVRSAAC